MSVKTIPSLTIVQALEQAPGLQQLRVQLAQSSACLKAVQPLLPPGLRQSVQAGPIDEQSWCLLVSHQAAAAKIRQLLPALVQALQQAQLPVHHIRIRVRRPVA